MSRLTLELRSRPVKRGRPAALRFATEGFLARCISAAVMIELEGLPFFALDIDKTGTFRDVGEPGGEKDDGACLAPGGTAGGGPVGGRVLIRGSRRQSAAKREDVGRLCPSPSQRTRTFAGDFAQIVLDIAFCNACFVNIPAIDVSAQDAKHPSKLCQS